MLKREIPRAQWAAITLLAASIFSLLLFRAVEKARPPEPPFPPPVIVEIQGDVPRTGIFVLPGPEATVADALTAAGWKAPEAPDKALPPDTASKGIETGERIQVHRPADGPPWIVVEPMDPATRFTLGFKLDLNRASEADLLLLPQMKPEWAGIIVERRQQAPWKRIEDLNDIPGIGPKTLEKWWPHLEAVPPSRE
jgi:competence protein ComEA